MTLDHQELAAIRREALKLLTDTNQENPFCNEVLSTISCVLHETGSKLQLGLTEQYKKVLAERATSFANSLVEMLVVCEDKGVPEILSLLGLSHYDPH